MMKQDKEIIRSVRKLAVKECANWQDGFCVPDDCPCRVINPRYSTVHDGCIDCDWFVKAVLPREPDLYTAYWHEIFREECDAGEGWKNCARCHKPFIPASNRQKYCTDCGQAAKRTRDRLKQQSYRLRKKAGKSVTV